MRRHQTYELGLHPVVEDGIAPRGRATPHKKRAPRLAAEPLRSCNLAEVMSQAVELGRGRAAARELRVHCYCVDGLQVAAEPYDLMGTIDAMLAIASELAVWGSLLVCQAGLEHGQVVVRIQFAVVEELGDGEQGPVVESEVSRVLERAPSLH